ncbi:MAG TPA: ABC transporter permease [Solirubrobacteraceae bacterium]|nr:ABC transporter permease [Solirubrobacteraceae bacterium]
MVWLVKYLTRLWRERKERATGQPAVAHAQHPDAPVAARAETVPNERASLARPSAASRGPIALLAHQVRYDVRASLRNPRARFFTFFFPIVLLVIFTGVFGHGNTTIDGTRVKLSQFYVPGILAMSIVVAAYGNLVVSIATLRESGVLKRRRATPAPPALLIAGQALSTLVIVVVMATLLLVIGKLLYGVAMAPAALAAIACTTVVGALAFACVGYAVSGLIGSPDAAQPIVQVTTLPLWFISGVFVPTANLSGTLRSVGSLFPVEHLAAGLQRASIHTSFASAISGSDLLVLAAWGFAAGAFAAWRFSWLPSTATT